MPFQDHYHSRPRIVADRSGKSLRITTGAYADRDKLALGSSLLTAYCPACVQTCVGSLHYLVHKVGITILKCDYNSYRRFDIVYVAAADRWVFTLTSNTADGGSVAGALDFQAYKHC